MIRRNPLRAATPWLFLSPFLILFGVFSFFPLLFSIFLSFQKWNPAGGLESMEYVGLDNYVLSLTDPWLWKALWNTIWLAIVSGIPQHLIAIPVAYLLVTAVKRMRHTYSAAIFMPYITSTVAVSLIFFSIYADNNGILNQVLHALATAPGLSLVLGWIESYQPIHWLSDSWLIKPAVAIVIIWKYTGFNVVIYSTGFLTLPHEILDAARVDGANAWHRFWYIALPMIRPFIFFGATLTLIGNLQLFEEPFVLTQGNSGGVAQAGLTLAYYLYLVGWQWLEMGTASAISWLLFLIVAVATSLHFWAFGRQGMAGDH